MKLLNYLYHDFAALENFVKYEKIKDGDQLLVQIFSSNTSDEKLLQVRGELSKLLPNSAIIGSSTAGVVTDNKISDGIINISFSMFEKSHVKAQSYHALSKESIVEQISKDLITPKTKLLICFANTFTIDAELLLKEISQKHPSLIIAGGNGSDDFKFVKCHIFAGANNGCADVAFAAIDSDVLQVGVDSLFNWQSVGKEFTVTKVEGSRLYELDNTPVLDIYENYLGSEIVDDILTRGTQFPLIHQQSNISIARAPVAVHEDGSLSLAGNLEEGMKVKFGYANVDYITDYNSEELLKNHKHKSEAVYVYTCAARRLMLGSYLDDEISIINNLAPVSGFVAYGEFFHNKHDNNNYLLNISTTYVTLSENDSVQPLSYMNAHNEKKQERDITLKALTTLITKTSEELDENLFYLQQFKEAVDEVSIFSVTNDKGIITYVNKNFETISGYTREELIGQNHNIVRHPDMPKELFKEMWQTVKNGKIWKGVVKNKRKDGKAYYVLTEISPIFKKDGTLKEYIGVRNDITELEEYKEVLKNELSFTQKSMEEHMLYVRQYEKAVNSTVAIVKTDTKNKIIFANHTFCTLSKYNIKELIGEDYALLRHPKHTMSEQTCTEIHKRLANKEPVRQTLTNIAKDGSEFTVDTVIYPMVDSNGAVNKHLHVMHDISEIIKLNEEIIQTQKEVVLTMGTIGETRSRETGLHVKRVAEYSYLLATLAGLPEHEAMLLKQASPMHDIGKVGIPDSILNKPGKLTEEEFEIMKTHASIGYDMLKHSERPILKTSAIVALTHHEKYDGSGYPKGTKGEDIHIYGRITAIADVFDALGHERVYKKAWELEKIYELLREERGKHFDPKLIDLFFENLDKFLEVKAKYESDF